MLENLYDPRTREGYRRYRSALDLFRKLLEHPWFRDLSPEVRVLDLCGGCGLGGAALCRALQERGYRTELTVLDLWREGLRVAEEWCRAELSDFVTCTCADAKVLPLRTSSFDLVLLYGYSVRCFTPWDYVRILQELRRVLRENSIIIVENRDVLLFLAENYEKLSVLVTSPDQEPVLSLHIGVNTLTGTVRRLHVGLESGRGEYLDLHFWYTSVLALLTYLYFEDVDVVQVGTDQFHTMVLGRRVRREVPNLPLEKATVITRIRGEFSWELM